MTIVNPTPAARHMLSLLRTYVWFDEIDAHDLSLLAANSALLRFAPDDELLREGQVASSCLLIHQGKIQGLRYTTDGDEKVFGQAGAGSMVSVLSLFLREPQHMYTVRAITHGEAFMLDSNTLRHLCKTNAALACRLLQHGAELARHHTDQLDWLTSSSAEERLAEYVLRVGKPQVSEPVTLPLTHNQIAVKLGMRPETLSRILTKWRQLAYISDKRDVLRILNIDPLIELAKGHE